MNWTRLLLSARGRINRLTFLSGLLPVIFLLALVWFYLEKLTGLLPRWADILLPAAIALEALYFLACLAAKRMHDYGRPAHFLWLLFSPLIVTGLFLIQQKYFHLSSYEGAVVVYTVLFSLAMLAFLWMLVELIFLRSDQNDNRFGAAANRT